MGVIMKEVAEEEEGIKLTMGNMKGLIEQEGRCQDFKEYYEIVNGSPPIGIFLLHMHIILQKCISDHETKQSSKFQSDPSSNCFTIDI